MPAPAQDPRSHTNPVEDSPTDPHEPHQLALQLFGRIDAYAAKPPERALWRELLNLAIGTVRTFRAHNRPFSAATVHHVGLGVCAAEKQMRQL